MQCLRLDPHRTPSPTALAPLLRHLDAGGVIAIPTDTIYGLAANACDAAAVAEVYRLKGRDFGKALPLLVRDREQAAALALAPPPLFQRLADAFWPGPLTLIVAAGPRLPKQVTGGGNTVGMRQPGLELLAALLGAVEYPLTATSANRSGAPECRNAEEVAAQFGGELALLVDGGEVQNPLPSTMLDLTVAPPRLVRAGAIAESALAPYLLD